MSLQIACPECGALFWPGGRCPWDRGSGCIGRSLVVPQPRRRPETAAAPKVASVPTPRAPRVPRPVRLRVVPKSEYDRKYAARRRAQRTEEEREAARAYHRQYMKAWRARTA